MKNLDNVENTKNIDNLENNNSISLSQFMLPQTAFSCGNGNQKVKFYYISDIHIIHHLNLESSYLDIESDVSWQNIKLQIDAIVDGLFSDELIQDIAEFSWYYTWRDSDFFILFGGDISSKTKITEYFYHRFQLKFIYYIYKAWRQKNKIVFPKTEEEAELEYNAKIDDLQTKRLIKIEKLKGWIDYNKKIKRNPYFDFYKHIKKKGLPAFLEYRIEEIKKIEYEIERLKNKKQDFIKELISGKIFTKPEILPIIAILGNHELIDFTSVDEAVNHYEAFFKNNRIFFFHNTGYCFRGFIAIGGIGFAKYNEKYNATNIVTTTPPMSRQEEIRQSEIFYEFYNHALEESKNGNDHLVVLSHYPVKDWLNDQTDYFCTYFTGHSHQNYVEHSETVGIYANNQIGYKDKNIKLKSCILGCVFNPFFDYKDGYHEITTQQYLQFYDYCGESIKVAKIENQINEYNAKFYMIKQSGFYGFFIINPTKDTKICAGGRLKNINRIKDINYFNDCFTDVLSKYIQLLLPYRKVQEQISADVKKLGFKGTIHGCIVDIDFFNHIMINPFDGSLTYYYSPIFGTLKKYNDFSAMLVDILQDEITYKNDKLPILEQMKKDNCLITKSTNDAQQQIGQMVEIDINESLYKVSEKINQWQRIFSSNILRDWNDDWTNLCLKDYGKYIKKLPQQINISTNNEWNELLDRSFEQFVSIAESDIEKGVIIWKTHGIIKQPMVYAILHKFLHSYHDIISNYREISFGFRTISAKRSENVSVSCLPEEVCEISKYILVERAQYNLPIRYYMKFNEKKIELLIDFHLPHGNLKYTGKYIFKDNQFVPV